MIELIKELQGHMQSVYSSQQITKLTARLGLKQRRILELVSNLQDPKDTEIQAIVYPDDKNSRAYDKTKQRLYFHLIQAYFIPKQARSLQDFDLYRNKSIEYTTLAKIMYATPCSNNTIHLVREGLKFSKKIGQTENIVELLRIKLNITGVVKQNANRFDKVMKEYEYYDELNEMENKLQLQYWEIYSKTKSHNYQLNNSKDILIAMRKNLDMNYSFKMNLYSYRTMILIYEIEAEVQSLFDLSIEAMDYLSGLKFDASRLQIFFMRRKYTASLKLKKYDELRKIFVTYFARLPKYSANWFLLKSYNAILLMHDRKYVKAYKSLPNVHHQATNISENIIEFYKLNEGFAKLMIRLEAIAAGDVVPKFRLFKLVNELPVHSKDKTGINVTILVMQVMYLIGERKFDDIIDRVDALQQYSYRHLKRNAVRSKTFIQMIIQMSKANFHPIRTAHYTKKLAQKLQSIPLELSEQPLEVEIVPYEHLWEIITTLLEQNAKPPSK